MFFSWVGISAQAEAIIEAAVEATAEESSDYPDADSILTHRDITTENQIFPKEYAPNYKSKYTTDEFNYSDNKPKKSFWERISDALDRFLKYIFGDFDRLKAGDITNKIIEILSVLSIAVALYFVIRFLMSKNGNWIFGKRNRKIIIDANDIVENIHEIDFPDTIARYEREQDFRSAIRYQFLYMLKKLTDKKLIDWNPEKTNRDYVAEITQSELKTQFKNAAYIFDYVWYGEFSINQKDYEQYKQESFNF